MACCVEGHMDDNSKGAYQQLQVQWRLLGCTTMYQHAAAAAFGAPTLACTVDTIDSAGVPQLLEADLCLMQLWLLCCSVC